MSTVLSEKNGRLFLSSLLCDNCARFLNKINREVKKEKLRLFTYQLTDFFTLSPNSSLQTLIWSHYRKIENHSFHKSALRQGILRSIKLFDEHFYISSEPVAPVG